MSPNQLIRSCAITELQRFKPSAHYLMRDHDPAADLELVRPLLERPASLGLTLRELRAAQALSDFAIFELRSRAIWDKAYPVQDSDAPRIEAGVAEAQAIELAGRSEVFRRSALAFARDLSDPQLIEAFQPPHQADRPAADTAQPAAAPSGASENDEPPAMVATPADYDAKLAALFDAVRVTQLEAMFPDRDSDNISRWPRYAERAKRNGLRGAAKEGRAIFNPYRAAVWWLTTGPKDWKLERCLRVLSNNLPPPLD